MLGSHLPVILAGLVNLMLPGPQDDVIAPPDILRLHVVGLPAGAPPVFGAFLVQCDGKVDLGPYGSVPVAGLPLDLARAVIADHLADRAGGWPVVLAAVQGFNSKQFYVIARAGRREDVHAFLVRPRETVANAVARVPGLAAVAARGGVWVVSPGGRVREVDWRAITKDGRAETNFALGRGDRVYVGGRP